MIKTILPNVPPAPYQPAPPVAEKPKAAEGLQAENAPKGDSITLSAEARTRLANEAAPADPAAGDGQDLQAAARRTIEGLKRNQAREFTARGIEVTDPDTRGTAPALYSVRDVTPQPVNLKDITA